MYSLLKTGKLRHGMIQLNDLSGITRDKNSRWDSYLWSIYFYFTITTIIHLTNIYSTPVMCHQCLLHMMSLLRTQCPGRSLCMHDLNQVICCWNKNSRYPISVFEVRSMFLLRKLTGRDLQFYSKTNLNCKGELYFKGPGPNNLSWLSNTDWGAGSCIQWWKRTFSLSTVSF